MAKVLLLFAHPVFEKSRVHASLVRRARQADGVTVVDLYERYPDFNIDTKAEKDLLAAHEVLVWQHPFYWYSCPALLKQWIDLVLEYGWAYGPGGNALVRKRAASAVTTGGPASVYTREGRNRHTVREFLAPFEQTALLCGMTYLDPFTIQGTHRLTADLLIDETERYGAWLEELVHG